MPEPIITDVWADGVQLTAERRAEPDELILSAEETESLRGWLVHANHAARGGYSATEANAVRMALNVVLQAARRQFGAGWGDPQ